MKLIKRFILVCVFFGFAWLGIYTYNRLTDGFNVHQITSSLPPYPQFEVEISEEKKEWLREILDQPYHYLGKGIQFYVFESADGNFVIKFLKHKHLRPFGWLRYIPMTKSMRQTCLDKIERRKQRVETLFTSCKLAYEEIPELTALYYIHLNRTPALETQVTLIDKVGLKHHINLDEYEFVIQQKAITVEEMFANISEEQVPEKVEQLIELISARHEKGICDLDRSFTLNVAFSTDGSYALFIDVGQFQKDPAIFESEERVKDLKKRMNNLRYWTGRYFPEFLEAMDQTIAHL